jgi:hypothetical protein
LKLKSLVFQAVSVEKWLGAYVSEHSTGSSFIEKYQVSVGCGAYIETCVGGDWWLKQPKKPKISFVSWRKPEIMHSNIYLRHGAESLC